MLDNLMPFTHFGKIIYTRYNISIDHKPFLLFINGS